MSDTKLQIKENLYYQAYDRVRKNLPYNQKFQVYTKKFILKTIKYFEDKEEYEICDIFQKFYHKRFDHEANYFNKE